ncbi:MAG: hypothetical protein EOO60_09195 [Hymenobacter sp.]|nr:MAG: hypothetical protein EOO60_09195 [Hymenobacter sp.]
MRKALNWPCGWASNAGSTRTSALTAMPTELVLTALEQALTLHQPAPGLIIHADRGSQYTSLACRTRIEKAQALASFSRPGNPYDNAQA